MKNSPSPIIALLMVTLLIAGCESTAITKRINERPEVFAALLPDQKAYVRDGIVFPGDTSDMAYIALGVPDKVETREKDDITVVMWTYSKYYPGGIFEEFLTNYSRTRNPNLLRKTDIKTGDFTLSDSVDGGPPSTDDAALGGGTHTGGVMAKFDLPDLPVYKLYVFYHRGKITDVKIESLDGTKFMWLEEALEMEKARELRKSRT